MMSNNNSAKQRQIKDEPLEKQLCKSADKLRKNIDASEYKYIVLGLIFLKYISDAFEELYDKLNSKVGDYEFADPKDTERRGYLEQTYYRESGKN